MSRHHNTKHDGRNRSHYLGRLIKRGLSKSPAMEDLEVLARRQNRRVQDTCTNLSDHDHDVNNEECDGVPWWQGHDEPESGPTPEEKLLGKIFRAS